MNSRIVLLLCACSTACADLPPVVGQDGSVPNPAINAAKPSTPLSTTYEMMKRMEQLQGEVQQLTGKVEEQAFQIDELKKQQKTMFTDFDDRIQSIENKSGGSLPTTSPSDSVTPPDGASTTEPPVPTTIEPSTSVEPPLEKPAETSSAAPSPAPAVIPPPVASAPPAQASAAETQEYQKAYDDLRNGRTDRAITGFNTYLSSHPGGAYASNSQYWLGEAHRVNQDNTAARKAFNSVLEAYPNSAKASDALLKLGYIEAEEKNTPKALEFLKRVTAEFPGTRAAGLAEKKLLVLEGSAPKL